MKPCCIASKQQPRIAGGARNRPQADQATVTSETWRARAEALAQHRIASHRDVDHALRVDALGAEHVFELPDDADVRHIAGKRRNPDVAVGPDVHFAARSTDRRRR